MCFLISDRDADITQIAAKNGEEVYTCYVTPTKPISPTASEKTGITCFDGQLYKDKQPVESLTPDLALHGLIDFIKSINQPILVGHNIKNFDCLVVHNSLRKEGLWEEFAGACAGFADTLEIFRKLFPNDSKVESYSQESLVTKYLGTAYSAHDALEDIKALERLYKKKVEGADIEPFLFSCDLIHRLVASFPLRLTFAAFIAAKHISSDMARKCSISGLSLNHIRKAYERDGSDGVRAVLAEKANGKVRITKNSKVIDKLCDGLKT